ncbi:MAG: Rha family transcriptional regulator, partial [Alphaproteobacteria bacterium]|nr:Rha family transcriptional regulator [Alphaproteobacteria bacterium]
LRAIENLIADAPIGSDFIQTNFGFNEKGYTDARGRQLPEYIMTRDGFALLAMGFTGAKAMMWKIAYIEAFNDMEARLHEREERFSNALTILRPSLKPVVEMTIDGADRGTIAQVIEKSKEAVGYHRRYARKLGLLPRVLQ